MSAPPPPQPPDSRTAATTSPRLLPLPSSQWHVPVNNPQFPAQLRSLLLLHCLFFPNPPPSLPPSQLPPLKKKKKKPRIRSSSPTPIPTASRHADHLLLPFRWIPAAVSTSPASPSGVERRRGRWPVRCGVVAGERLLGFAASEKVSGVFWKLRCDAPATARKGLQVCDTGVILLVGWGFAFRRRGGLGGRFGRGDWKQSR
uniref:Uncharacterized protein n=1 Tax=Oryza glumipatula TaxID=40148 RepID=A0A0D9Z1K1_9ORYZ